MAKAWTQEQIDRRHREGRGRGEGINYKSWLSAHNVPSRGRTTRMTGRLIRRQYVVFSDIERHCLLALQRLPNVIDVREQFPLWPLTSTQEIAAELGVKHPAHDGQLVVMTTDFLITIRDGSGMRQEAIAVKRSEALEDRRTLEKLEIECRYWRRRGVLFRLVTERDIPAGLVSNLEWMDEFYDLDEGTVPSDMVIDVLGRVARTSASNTELSLAAACALIDGDLGLNPGSCLSTFRHALARRLWTPRLDVKIDPRLPLGILGGEGTSSALGPMCLPVAA